MLISERHRRLIDYLNENGFATVHDLSEKLYSSLSTVRRDLAMLEDEGVLKRTWGGAMRKAVAKSMVEKEVDYKPFAAEAVKALKTRGFTLVIASTTRRINLEAYKSVNRNIVSKARLEDYFSAIYTHEDVENIKPAPDIHLRLMREFNVLPSECLVFEDSLVGVMAAKNAGIEVCAVYDEHSDGDREKISFLADYKIHDFSELSKLIKVR